MKKSVYSSICIVMLMGLLPFSPKAQDTVIYPYMNYLNMPCDDPSEYFCYNTQRGGHGNDGVVRVCEKDSVYEAGVFNYPVADRARNVMRRGKSPYLGTVFELDYVVLGNRRDRRV